MKSYLRLWLLCAILLISAGAVWAGLHDAPYSYAFAGWAAIVDDWTNSGTTAYTTGHDAPNSVKLDNTGDYIISPTIDVCDTMKVWLKGNSTTTPGIFKIYAQVGTSGWTEIRTCTWGAGNDIDNGNWAQLIIALAPPFRGVDDVSFKFVYELKNVGNVALDDFSVTQYGADTTPPTLLWVGLTSRSAIDAHFSEPVALPSAETVGNYTVDNGVGHPLTATRDAVDFSTVHLTFNTLAPNTYTLTANGVQDPAGNPCVNSSAGFVISSTVNPGDVVINEIMYDDTASVDSEWVELHNRTASAVDISGWILTDAGTYPPTVEGALEVPAGTTIPAHGYLVLSRDQLPGITGNVQCNQYTAGSWGLANAGDNLALYTAATNGMFMDGSLSSFYPDLTSSNDGNSIEKCDENSTWSSDPAAWHMSTHVFADTGRYHHCTPGTVNSACVVDNTPPTLVSAAPVTGTTVNVTFSEDVDATTSQVVTNYSVNNGVGNPTSALRQSNAAVVQLTFASALVPNTYTLTVNNVRDLANNVILPNSQVPFTVLPRPANFVFTEFMANPNLPGLADSLGEWFEIYNAGTSAVNLNGWVVCDNAGCDTIEGAYSVNPGQYFVFCSNSDPLGNGGVPFNYAYQYGTSGWGLSLNNTADSLSIKDAAGTLAASLKYTASFPFSEGRAAQLRDLTWNPAVDTNWCRADTSWSGAYMGDRGTPQHATICAPIVPVQAYTICDIREQDAFGVSVLDLQRVITQGVVTHVDSCRRNAYIESNGCAVMIYGNAVRDTMVNIGRHVQVGDFVEVNGYLKNYRGLTEIDSSNGVKPAISLLGTNHALPAPVTVTAAQVSKAVNDCSPEMLESRHVRIQNVTFVDGGSIFSAGTSGLNYNVVSGTDTLVFRVVPCDTLVGDTIPSGPITLNCIASQFDNTSPFCGGYQMTTGRFAPFGSGQCSTPVALNVYRDGVNNRVILRWAPGVDQQCDCYEIWYTADGAAHFPTGYTLLNHVSGVTQYTDTDPFATKRFYIVRAGGPSCP